MQIEVNGSPREVDAGATVADLLDRLGLDPRTLAVERNRQLSPRDQHAATPLVDGDRIEIVTLVGGG